MRILKDFKIPDFKFKKIEMNDIPNVEDVKGRGMYIEVLAKKVVGSSG